MIRLFSLTLLLSLASAVYADTLYRWVETDGSITFSPKKPPAGIEYKVVGEKSAEKVQPSIVAPASTQPATTFTQSAVDKRGVDASVSWMNSGRQGTQGSQDSEPPFAAARPVTSQTDSRVSSVASDNKRARQCSELNMRVTSLEERMRARLTPAAMDNTVMSMVRYQQSLDQFCN